ncbi:hypothetical protein MOF34_20670 [Bacillus sp. T17B1]|uniref:hypothetical protein n=1 Tax=Bacillus sp. T17B1 TaxID=2918911 RepID=UPI002281E662|nr:hypothetical protein [Bacillus sp. T17B1]
MKLFLGKAHNSTWSDSRFYLNEKCEYVICLGELWVSLYFRLYRLVFSLALGIWYMLRRKRQGKRVAEDIYLLIEEKMSQVS